jgi:hypothetical protein
MHTTWYVLENGALANPDDVAPDEAGRLVHSSGVLVAMRGDVPRTRGVDAEALRAMEAAGAKPADADREMRPAATGRPYRTRGGKAD